MHPNYSECQASAGPVGPGEISGRVPLLRDPVLLNAEGAYPSGAVVLIMRTMTAKSISLIWASLMLVVMGWVLPTPALNAYVLSGEQVLALMAKKRTFPQTLEVKQAVSQLPDDDVPRLAELLRETLYYSFPDRLRSDTLGEDYRRISIRTPQDAVVVVNGQVRSGAPERFEIYKNLLLMNSRAALETFLGRLGIDLNQTRLDRFEENYCVVIGARDPLMNTPQLWVQKDSFLPLRLKLPPPLLNPQEGALDVRYRDWGQIEGALYPMLIQIYRKHQLFREMRVENLRVDLPLDTLLFDAAALRATLPQWMPAPIKIVPPEAGQPEDRPPAPRP